MKHKGFTLIELLAVIVILAIIALMVTPMIQDLIESSRYASAVDSALAYVAGANSQAASDTGIGGFEDFSLNLTEEDSLETGITDEELAKIKYKGKGPTYVYLHFDTKSKQVSDAKFCIWGFSIDYDNQNGASKSDISYCGETEPEGEVSCDVLRGNTYDDTTTFKINNVEDLVCISEMAKTKTFEGKTIYLIKDIDFNEDSSYENPNGTDFGDINGNGNIEGLKTELTTASGFYPIGSSTVPFKGLFEGYAKSISNLMINRTQDNVGLFGYNQGTIRGFTIFSNITGNGNVGGLVGNNSGTVNEIAISSNVEAAGSNCGGVVGVTSNNSIIKSVLVKAATVKSSSGTGGILGYGTKVTLTGIIEGGTVTGNHFPGIIAGRNSTGSYTGYYASGRISGTTGNYNGGGYAYVLRDEILNAYDKVLDTYIGGDNDDSGYYFDYESDDSSNIVIKRVTKNPIKFTLKGHGTETDPYIIDNYNHYKEATTLAGDGNSYKFKITEDIDFSGKHYYALGTNGNTFNSDISGDMHTLSNIAFNCAENCGLISQNSKTIEGLNLNNITITSGNDNVGSLVGYNTGMIKGINVSNVVLTGNGNVGGIVGNNNGTVNEIAISSNVEAAGSNCGGVVGVTSNNSIIKSVLVKAATVKSSSGTGGILGYGTKVTLTGIIEGGTVTGNHFPGIIAGRNSTGSYTGYYASGRISGTTGNYNGGGIGYTLVPPTTVTYSNTEIDSLTYYNNVGVLDTVINGDDDNSGYYMQYNDSADSIIVVKAGSTSNSSNPSNPVNTSSPVPIIETKVGDNPPTCVLNEVIPRSAGIQAVLTCEDEEGAPIIRSQWNVNKNAVTNQFSDTGIIKEGTVSGNSKTVRPYWSTSNTISVPTPNTCYYYRFGAQDASGNWSYYVTDECYYGFSN